MRAARFGVLSLLGKGDGIPQEEVSITVKIVGSLPGMHRDCEGTFWQHLQVQAPHMSNCGISVKIDSKVEYKC